MKSRPQQGSLQSSSLKVFDDNERMFIGFCISETWFLTLSMDIHETSTTHWLLCYLLGSRRQLGTSRAHTLVVDQSHTSTYSDNAGGVGQCGLRVERA